MEINHLSIHRLNIENNQVEAVTKPTNRPNFDRYINNLLGDIANDTKGKKFKIRHDTTQVISIVKKGVLNSVYKEQHAVAQRLIEKENDAQQMTQRMGVEIRPGILLQACVEHLSKRKYIICKAENVSFISGNTFDEDLGYPQKRKVIKSFIITYSDNGNVEDIMITDSNSVLAKYWWDDFLELDKGHDDIYNTTTAFNAIDNILSKKLKGHYPADHMHLRNSTIRAFRNQGDFQFDYFIDQVFRNYTPVDSHLNIGKLADELSELPTKKGFDNRFETVASEIKARLKSVVELTDSIDLHIKEGVNTDNTIESVLIKKVKYIRIRTDVGYDTFLKNQTNGDGVIE